MNKLLRNHLLLILGIILICCEKNKSGLPVDGDGNVYDTVVIGTQVWFAKNLQTTKYNNGVPIPLVNDNLNWTSMKSGAYCWYNNTPDFKEDFGALYNWYSINTKICPAGWHVPTLDEWNSLINYLGGVEIAGDKLKATGSLYWGSDNCATNETEFTAMPGGLRHPQDGTFRGMSKIGSWWSSSPAIGGWHVGMYSHLSGAYVGGLSKTAGYSIRCIKD